MGREGLTGHREEEVGFYSHRRVLKTLDHVCGGLGMMPGTLSGPDTAVCCGPQGPMHICRIKMSLG